MSPVLRQLDTGQDVRRGSRPQRIHVEARAVADAAGARAAVPKMQRQRVRRRGPAPSQTGMRIDVVALLQLDRRCRSTSVRVERRPSPGLISAALSHVSFVSDLGSSCSQALLAKRPS